MTSLKKISVLALLCLASTPSWSRPVDFCKVKRIYDADISIPPQIVYEDCSGVAFYDYAKNFVKASCWKDAINLLEGKCENHQEANNPATENSMDDVPEEASPLN